MIQGGQAGGGAGGGGNLQPPPDKRIRLLNGQAAPSGNAAALMENHANFNQAQVKIFLIFKIRFSGFKPYIY